MRIGQAFPSSYLKKEDVGNGVNLTIKDVKVEDVGGNKDPADQKPVIYFHESDRGMTCNKTNAEIITQIMGTDDTDQWIGKQICLYDDPTIFFGGKITGGIRVRPVQLGQQPAIQTSAQPQRSQPPLEQTVDGRAAPTFKSAPGDHPPFDDDIPFN